MPIKSYEQQLQEEAVRKQELQRQRQARYEELAAREQMEQRHAAERVERDHEQELFARRVEYGREHGRQVDPSSIKSLNQLYTEDTERRRLEAERIEAERIASITPRQLWVSTLNWQDKQRVLKWEAVNKLPFPVSGLE